MTTTVFSGGPIHTGIVDELADWVVVDGDTIAASGEGEPPRAERRVDLDGAVLVPAFRDGHVHLPATGLYESAMDFRGERSASAIVEAFARAADDARIPFGGNFEDPLDEPLVRHDLDRAVGPRPALLARADLHSCVVSTALLERLELGGLDGVDRDADGAPTGHLRERAASEAWRWFDASLTPEQQRDAVLAGVRAAYSKGVAEAHEMFVVEWRGWESAERFLETISEVSLNVPVYLGTDEVDRVHEMGFRRIGGDWFLDGSFGSHTAWMNDPYASAPPTGSAPTGISYRSDAEVHHFFRRAQERAMQVGVHAIGDAAIAQALRCWQRVATEVGPEQVRRYGHRIEHFECAGDGDMEAAAELGLHISVQPAFDRYWGGPDGLYSSRIGWPRARRMNWFRTMLDTAVHVGGGSDSTVTPLDPFLQMASLRQHHVSEQSLDPLRALSVMTHGVAQLAATEGPRGLLAAGGWADLALLDRDPLAVDPDEVLDTEVLGTWVGGRRVWPADEAEAP